jgi:hypothetical protein
MREPAPLLAAASQAVSYMLGGLVIALALGVMATSVSAVEITTWAWDVLGLAFATLLGSLAFIALLCWVKIKQLQARGGEYRPWLVAGVQAANGIATLALTYTLLGISLGIGSLAGQQLTPDTIQGVIKSLTENFSMAFMTTVVGLPTSALLRSLLLVAHARKSSAARSAAAAAERGNWRPS